ncbi:hypothetical protein D3Z45_04905 [Lachnospiraceae bacterium]|nr:hypothetical protein [Lachnospiraceae bacterium]
MPTDILQGMYTVFLENRVLSYIFLALLLLSIICQIIIGVIYLKLIKQTDNMACTKSKFLKQCKLKFINCYQISGEVTNVPVFVDKSMTKISFLGISMSGLHHLAGQFVLLSVVTAGAGACQEITQGETVGKILPYYVVSFFGLYVYFSVSGIVDIAGKKERLKINLVDYLENHMANKLKQSDVDWEKLTGENLSAEKRKAHLWKMGLQGKKKGVHKKKAAGGVKEIEATKKKGNPGKAEAAWSGMEPDKGRGEVKAGKINIEKAKGRKKKDKKGKNVAAAGLDAKEKKRLLREGIGLSAERETQETAKVMAFAPAGEQDKPQTVSQEEMEHENIRRDNAEEGKPEGVQEEEKVAVFSHQEAEELEELLQELLV